MKDIHTTSQVSRNKLATVLIFTVILLSLLDIFLFYKLSDVKMVEASYNVLENRTQILEGYYQQLQGQYSRLMKDYTDMKARHDALIQSNALLQREYDDVLNHGKQLLVEEKNIIRLKPSENTTIFYEMPMSGYIEVEMKSTKEMFVWVGSSLVDGVYYARFPSFPQTATMISFRVPVSPTMFFFIENAETDEAEIEYSINLIY